MKTRKLSIMLIVAVLLVALAFAGAASAETHVVNGKELQNAIAAGENYIVLDSGSKFFWTHEKLVIDGTKDITIDLNGNIWGTLSGNGEIGTRVIEVGPSATLTLKDSKGEGAIDGGSDGIVEVYGNFILDSGTLESSFSEDGGGVYIHAHGKFTMNGGKIYMCNGGDCGGGVCCGIASVFIMNGGIINHCEAETGSGGGVYLERGSSFTMNGGTISECRGDDWGGGVANGGEFTMNGGLIENCDTNSEGYDGGGGVAVANKCTFTMNGGMIRGCKADNGGGVYVSDEGASFGMNGGTIESCTAEDYGGGVYLTDQGSFFFMDDGTIKKCRANSEGGGVYLTGINSEFLMNDGQITECSAKSYGGGVFVNNEAIFNLYGGLINGCVVDDGKGGGVYVDDDSDAQINIKGNPIVIGNSHGEEDDDIYLEDNDLLFLDGDFTGCIGISNPDGTFGTHNGHIGAGFFFKSSDNTVKGKDNDGKMEFGETIPEFKDITAAVSGLVKVSGPITEAKTYEVGNPIRLLFNTLVIDAGDESTPVTIKMVNDNARIIGLPYLGETGYSDPVITVNEDRYLTLTGKGTISGGHAKKGGGIYVDENGQLDIDGITISDCYATENGGGIYAEKRAQINIGGATSVINNKKGNEQNNVYLRDPLLLTSPLTGGTVGITYSGDKPILGDIFGFATASRLSGAEHFVSDDDELMGKLETTEGGDNLLRWVKKETKAVTTEDELRAAVAEGGRFYLNKDIEIHSKLVIGDKNDVVLDLNGHRLISEIFTASSFTNRMIEVGPFATLTVMDSKGGGQIYGNLYGHRGGLVEVYGHFILDSGTLYGSSEDFTHAEDGGGVYLHAYSKFTMNGGKIDSCAANTDGGGVFCCMGSRFTMNGGTINHCKAETGSGGGVYLDRGSRFTMNGGTIMDCHAEKWGGGVADGGEFTLNGGIIENCEADSSDTDSGGGVAVASKCTFTMNDGTIRGCKADQGGGVYVSDDGASFGMNGGTIESCTAEDYGGGVYLTDKGSFFFMNGGTIKKCRADDEGGGVYLDGEDSEFLMNNGQITECSAENYGGGVFVDNKAIFNLYGGAINGCVVDDNAGGGVYVDRLVDGYINIKGNPIVIGNSHGEEDDDIYLENFGQLSLCGDFTGCIGISNQDGTFGSNNGHIGAGFFFKNSDNTVKGKDNDGKMEFGETIPEFKDITSAASGLVKVSGPITEAKTYEVGNPIRLLFNTLVIDAGDESKPVTIKMVNDNARIIGLPYLGETGYSDPVITVNEDRYLTLTGKGTLSGGHATKGGGIYLQEFSHLDIDGITISDCHATENGGGIYAEKRAQIEIGGGTSVIDNKKGDEPNNVYLRDTLLLPRSLTGGLIGITYSGDKPMLGDIFGFAASSTLSGAERFVSDDRKLEGELETTEHGLNQLKWVERKTQLTVTFYVGTSKATVEPKTKKVIRNAPYGPLPTPTHPSSKFGGWYLDRYEWQKEVTENTIVESDIGNHLLFAKWFDESVSVNFDAQGGSVSPSTKQVTVGLPYGALPIPVRDGHVFIGWYLDKACSQDKAVIPTTIVSTKKEHTLYAKWIDEPVTVTFDSDGGSVSPSTKQVGVGLPYGALPIPVRDGHVFAGWYLDKEHSPGKKVTATTIVTTKNDHTLHACWIKQLTVTFDADGGSVSPSTIQVIQGDRYGSLPTPVRAGYSFVGWYDDAGNKITSKTKVTKTVNHTLKAKWSATPITVTFDARGGSVDPATKQVYEGEPYGELPTPVYPGWSFQGWYDDAYNKVTAETQVTKTSDHTLTAKWIGPIMVSNTNVDFGTKYQGEVVGPIMDSVYTTLPGSVTLTFPSGSNFEFTKTTDGTDLTGKVVTIEKDVTYKFNITATQNLPVGFYSAEIPITYTENSEPIELGAISVTYSVIDEITKEDTKAVVPALPTVYSLVGADTEGIYEIIGVEGDDKNLAIYESTKTAKIAINAQNSVDTTTLHITNVTKFNAEIEGKSHRGITLASDSLITAEYPSGDLASGGTYATTLAMKAVSTNIPALTGEFKNDVAQKISFRGYTPVAMVSTINKADALTTMNDLIKDNGVNLTFTVSQSQIPASAKDTISVFHVDSEGLVEKLDSIKVESKDGKYLITATGSSFSSYVVAFDTQATRYEIHTYEETGGTIRAPVSAVPGTQVTIIAEPDTGYEYGGLYIIGETTLEFTNDTSFIMPAEAVTLFGWFSPTSNRGHSASISKDYTPSSSVPVMVQETAKPTTTPTAAVPTVMPTTKPTTQATTSKSPAPLAGLMLGLGAIALLIRMRR